MKERTTEPKLVIAVRKDLGLSKGKMAVQVAHASVSVIKNTLLRSKRLSADVIWTPAKSCVPDWVNGIQKKIVVWCDDEDHIMELARQAEEKGLKNAVIRDCGLTEVDANTVTCVGIGPAMPEDIDEITGSLSLVK